MALKECILLLDCVVFFACLPDMVHADLLDYGEASVRLVFFILLFSIIGSMVVIVGLVLAVYFCYSKYCANPSQGADVTRGDDLQTIVHTGDPMAEWYPDEHYPGIYNEGMENEYPDELYLGTYSDGMENEYPDEQYLGTYSEGMENEYPQPTPGHSTPPPYTIPHTTPGYTTPPTYISPPPSSGYSASTIPPVTNPAP